MATGSPQGAIMSFETANSRVEKRSNNERRSFSFFPPSAEGPPPSTEGRLGSAVLMALSWGTAASAIGGSRLAFAGREFTGYLWVVQATIGGLALAFCRGRRSSFPFSVWLPWLIWITLLCDFGDVACVQRTLMLWAGPIVAASTSVVVRGERQLIWLLQSLRAIVLTTLAFMSMAKLGLFPPGIWFNGSSLMAICLAASALVPGVLRRNAADTALWLCCLGLCGLRAFRATIVTCALTLPLTPLRLSFAKRSLTIMCFVVCVCAVLALPNVRGKMLKNTGYDSLLDLMRNPQDLYSSGRFYMWGEYVREARKRPLLGHGGNASYWFGMNLAEWAHPHCEYIRVLFDYGIVGLALLGVAIINTLITAYRGVRNASSLVVRDGWVVTFGGFVSLALLGITDNVILYIVFFGCLLFGVLGATHSVHALHRGEGFGRQQYAMG